MAVKPVVFVPGFPASELRQRSTGRLLFPPALSDLLDPARKRELLRLLVGPDDPPGDVVAGEPIRDILGIAKQAQSLYDLLRDFGYTPLDDDLFRPVGWDWRKAVDDPTVQDDLARAIDELATRAGAPVVALVHSTGGLVFRRLLETRPELAARIEQVLAFGVPWAGNLAAVENVARGVAIRFLVTFLSAGEVQEVMSHAQAAYDLFPPDPARTDLHDPFGKPLNLFITAAGATVGPLVDTSWIPAGRDDMRERARSANARLGARANPIALPGGVPFPPITNVAGWGVPVGTRCVLAADGGLQFSETDQGDGTVALASSSWLRGPSVRTFYLPIGVYPVSGIPFPHARIWDSPPVRQILAQVLKGEAPAPYVCGAADGDQAIDPRSDVVTLRLVAQDGEGRPLPNAKATFHRVAEGTTAAFGAAGRAEVRLKRVNLAPNVGADLLRFVVQVTWDGGGKGREVPMLIRV
jgi:hypothetical protein